MKQTVNGVPKWHCTNVIDNYELIVGRFLVPPRTDSKNWYIGTSTFAEQKTHHGGRVGV